MARGDTKFFASFFQKGFDGVAFDLNAGDTLKMGIVNNSTVPSVGTADPRWAAGGSTNFLANQVALATAYNGPITLASVIWTRAAGIITLDFADVAIVTDAGGFTDGYWAIIYDDTVAAKYCVGFIDLGGPVSIAAAPLNINLNVGGFGTHTYL